MRRIQRATNLPASLGYFSLFAETEYLTLKKKIRKGLLSFQFLEALVLAQLVPRQCAVAKGQLYMVAASDRTKKAKKRKRTSFPSLYCMPAIHHWAGAALTLPIPEPDNKPVTQMLYLGGSMTAWALRGIQTQTITVSVTHLTELSLFISSFYCTSVMLHGECSRYWYYVSQDNGPKLLGWSWET